MTAKEEIKHSGIITRIENNIVYVEILAKSACASCRLNKVCGSDDLKEKIIEVANTEEEYTIGENVDVCISEKMGFKALFYGYLFPFFVVLATLLICYAFTNKEGLSGILSIASLAPYYLILSRFRKKLKNTFQFNIHKKTR